MGNCSVPSILSGLNSDSAPCGLGSYLIYGIVFFFSTIIWFWWIAGIILILPILVGIILDRTTSNSQIAQYAMSLICLFELSAIAFLFFNNIDEPMEFYIPPSNAKNSQDTTPRCIFEKEISCTNFAIHQNSIDLMLMNQFADMELKIKSIRIGGCESTYANGTINSGESKSFTVGGSCNNGKPNKKFESDVAITYTYTEIGLEYMMPGYIVGKIS